VSAAEIDDRKSSHSEGDAGLNQYALIVGTAMRYYAAHAIENLRAFIRAARSSRVPLIYESGNATHKLFNRRSFERF
jgi:hypothetical protein